MPNNLTLALGSMQATPLEVATGFAVFANGGYHVEPFYIDRIEGPGGTDRLHRRAAHGVRRMRAADLRRIGCASAPSDRSQRHPRAADAAARRPRGAARPAEQAITPQVTFLMNDIMRDVITRGTGRRALALGRTDLRGKTGTTNYSVDTWFNGFNDSLVASVWVGIR